MSATTREGWNHNTHYHDRLLRAVPQPCGRALDVGCGVGQFARRLARVVDEVDAIDVDAAAIREARERSVGAANLRFVHADFMTWSADQPYDFVSLVASLHHLPFAAALTRSAHLLRPGGLLVVLGLDRAPSVFHAAARSLPAFPISRYYRLRRGESPVSAPTVEPTMTLREIREQAAAILSGVVVRRHLLWRYSIVWTKPSNNC